MLLYVVFIYSFIFQLRITLFIPCEEYVNYGDYSHSFRAFWWAIYITKNVDSTIHLHRRKMSAHALLKMTRDLFRAMSLAPRQKCPRNVVEMKEAMAAFFGSDSVAISCHCKRSKIILVKVLT